MARPSAARFLRTLRERDIRWKIEQLGVEASPETWVRHHVRCAGFVVVVRREVLEESGVHVEVTGLVRVEHRPTEHGCRVRVFVVAEALAAVAGGCPVVPWSIWDASGAFG